jgi:uncharacterized protein (DUF433 family)
LGNPEEEALSAFRPVSSFGSEFASFTVIASRRKKNGHCMTREANVIVSDPEILGGTLVFRGTRVPFKNLLDYLEGGHNLDEFLEQFPSVTRDAAIAALEHAKELVIAQAR